MRHKIYEAFLRFGLLIAAIGIPTSATHADDDRLPLPAKSAREAGDELIEDVFGEEIAAAKTPKEMVEIAKKLFDASFEEKNPANRFALLNRARTVSIEAGDLEMSLKAVNDLVTRFQIDPAEGRLSTLKALAAKRPEKDQAQLLALEAAKMMEEAIARDDFDFAAKCGSIALATARMAGNADLIEQLVDRGKQFVELRKQVEAIKKYRDALKTNPDDAEANLAVGKYYCLLRRDWAKGLPFLAKGSDADLKAASKLELSGSDEDRAAEVGNAWWDLAEKSEGGDQIAIKTHALRWYEKALPHVSGLTEARIEKRLEENAALLAADAGESQLAAAVESGSKGRRPLGVRGALIYVADEMKAGRITKTEEAGFTLGKTAFSQAPPSGGLLIGFDICLGTFGKIGGLRPIFQTLKGQVLGNPVGVFNENTVRLLAKKGYAVGSVTINPGIGIDGMGVVFMKIGNGELDATNSYRSVWFGKAAEGDKSKTFGGDGRPVVGIFGHRDTSVRSPKPMALGLITVAKEGEEKK